ncbi:MAG: methylmalonyl Co-A mutase-associated GTPase MeaB [Deltaproteobacteria bacterium]|nr:methylmalonyl Co-A mutase-associated GTPase MeaB [Deltaproteobacteria bacterium]
MGSGNKTSDTLVKRILKGDGRAAAKALTLIENRDGRAREILKALFPYTGKAHIVGVTGPTGSGKSTVIARLTSALRKREKKVGVLTVDPSSPFSGGALLGDRLRLRGHFLDEGVFIRSLATRGGFGGLSGSIHEATQLLDAMGKETIFVETIGVGQDQVEVSNIAHTAVVVLSPWTGDEVQAMKAGLMEVADLLVVNKADLSGAEEMFQQLKTMFGDAGVPVFQTSAKKDEGIDMLVKGIEEHRSRLAAGGDQRRRNLNSCRTQLLFLLRDMILGRALKKIGGDSFDQMVEKIAERRLDPYTAAEKILKRTG